MTFTLAYDAALVDELAVNFKLRPANKQALHELAARLADGVDGARALVMDMATGAGKTYVIAAFIEYLRRLGHRNVMIVTPGLVVQTKTVANFTRGSSKFIEGAPVDPQVITPDNYKSQPADQSTFTESAASNIFVFNVQQLIAPKTLDGETTSGGAKATARGIRKFSEYAGVLYDDLAELDDLVILADEHHLYREKAKAFHAAIKDLRPAVLVGFTASADKDDDVVFRYTLKQAIADRSVKQPIIAYRQDGYGENGEYQQLKDAKTLLDLKAQRYASYAALSSDSTTSSASHLPTARGTSPISPVMLVVCEDIAHATRIEEMLVGADFFGEPYAVLRVDSDSMTDEKAALLADLDTPDSPVRAVVSVNKLKEGWDTRSIAVMVTLRAMDSDILTQQTLGRGLRLPFGSYTGDEAVDTLDIVAHESFKRLLKSEKVLASFGVEQVAKAKVAETPVVPPVTPPPGLVIPLDGGDTETTGGAVAPGGSGDQAGLGGTGDTATTGTGTGLGNAGDHAGTTPGLQPGLTGKTREIGGDGVMPQDWYADVPAPPVVELVERFRDVSFLFPRTSCMREDTWFPLHKLTQDQIVAAAHEVSNDASGVLERYKLEFASHSITPKRLKQMTLDALSLPEETVRKEIKAIILKNRLVESNTENVLQLDNRIVRVFMDNVTIDHWTVDALITAQAALGQMLDGAIRAFSATLQPTVRLVPLRLPREHRRRFTLGADQKILPRPTDDSKYMRYQFYDGWEQNLYTAAAFDSDSGEAKLACDLDVSPDVAWWTRLYGQDEASVEYGVRQHYHPDFIVRDTEGRTWIVEGKDEGGRTNETVQRKRQAAEEAINLMASHPDMAHVKVGYVIAYEGDIAKAGSWQRLLAISKPIKSAN